MRRTSAARDGIITCCPHTCCWTTRLPMRSYPQRTHSRGRSQAPDTKGYAIELPCIQTVVFVNEAYCNVKGFVEASSTQSLTAESLRKVRSDITSYRASIGTYIFLLLRGTPHIHTLLSCSYIHTQAIETFLNALSNIFIRIHTYIHTYIQHSYIHNITVSSLIFKLYLHTYFKL